jgi:N-methylhydantoinase A
MPEAKTKRRRVGVDIGGTFTDLIVVDDQTGDFIVNKILSSPQDPSLAIEVALTEALEPQQISIDTLATVVHGTTLVTNALIERKGDPAALFATEGFRDSIEIGRESRYDLYDLMIENPRPLVPRWMRFGVAQRTLSDGSTLKELDVAHVAALARELWENGIVAIAVSFLNSFANPAAERAARDTILEAAPGMRVSISSEVSPSIREFERTSTTVANVYVQARVERYLTELRMRLERLQYQGNLFMMLSSGGIATLDTSIAFPIRLLESGPAAGALAAASYGMACQRPDLVSFDMGGTTAKFCVISEGKPLIAQEFEFDRVYRFKKGSGLPAKIPVIELAEIGAGGGSIARVDPLGLLKVGPDSSGADPGPVCYARGATEPTVTDADLVLGYLDPAFFLGGRMKLDIEGSRRAIQDRIASKLGISLEAAAWGIHQVVNENMAIAARAHVLERGHDPQRLPLFAFGGAGPVHAFRLARALGSPEMIAPLGAGIMSTVGFLTAPTAFDFARPWRVELDRVDWPRANRLLAEMETEGDHILLASGVERKEISVTRAVDMRYVGQGHEIQVDLPSATLSECAIPALKTAFEERYAQLYGRPGPPVPLEMMNWRVVVSGPRPSVALRVKQGPQVHHTPLKGTRLAYFPEASGFLKTPVYDRYQMAQGLQFEGPAIVEERESTLVIGFNTQCHVDEQWNLIVRMS